MIIRRKDGIGIIAEPIGIVHDAAVKPANAAVAEARVLEACINDACPRWRVSLDLGNILVTLVLEVTS